MAKDNEWSTIDVSPNAQAPKVEFEIEGQEKAPEVVEKKVEAQVEKNEEKQQNYEVEAPQETTQNKEEERSSKQAPSQENPQELAGIETRGAQKRIRQLIRQRKERDEEINRLRSEVEKLQTTVGYRERELTETVKNNIEATTNQLQSRLEQAKVLFKKASEQGDTDGMLAAQDEISKARAEEVALRQQREAINSHAEHLERAEKARPTQQTTNTQQPQYDPKAIEWARKNTWFGKDQLLTNAALSVDAELKQEGFDPTDDEYYEEVDARLAAQFPSILKAAPTVDNEQDHTTAEQKAPPSRPSQVVSGASRSPKTSSSNKNRVKLSQRDVALAQKWGIPLEQYAAEKLKAEQAEGDYTTVQ